MDMTLDEISKMLGEITQGDWVAMSLDGYPIVGVKHPSVDDSKKWQLKVISVLTTDQMKGLGKAVKIELDDEDRANLSIIAAAPTIIRELVEKNKAILARNEELCGELGWHKRELEEKVDEIYWLADDKIDLRDENTKLQKRVDDLESALGAIKEEAAAFASDERDLGYIFIGIYTLATNVLDAKGQDDD